MYYNVGRIGSRANSGRLIQQWIDRLNRKRWKEEQKQVDKLYDEYEESFGKEGEFIKNKNIESKIGESLIKELVTELHKLSDKLKEFELVDYDKLRLSMDFIKHLGILNPDIHQEIVDFSVKNNLDIKEVNRTLVVLLKGTL